jgi:hypothetical protein
MSYIALPLAKSADFAVVDIEADGAKPLLGKATGKRQPGIAEA